MLHSTLVLTEGEWTVVCRPELTLSRKNIEFSLSSSYHRLFNPKTSLTQQLVSIWYLMPILLILKVSHLILLIIWRNFLLSPLLLHPTEYFESTALIPSLDFIPSSDGPQWSLFSNPIQNLFIWTSRDQFKLQHSFVTDLIFLKN